MSGKLAISQKEHGTWKILALDGRMDALSSPDVDKEGMAVLDTDQGLALDLTSLVYISSAGLRVIMRFMKKAETDGKKIAIVGAAGTVLDMLEYSGISTLFSLYKTAEELP